MKINNHIRFAWSGLKLVEESDQSFVQSISQEDTGNEVWQGSKLLTQSEKPIIQNVVATCDLNCNLNIQEINRKVKNSEYNPKRHSALFVRIRDPKSTALIFSSGKIIVVGLKSEDHAKLAARKFARIIQKLGYNAKFSKFRVQNVVASCYCGFNIDLTQLNRKIGGIYELERFSGLVYDLCKPKLTFLIFSSGKLIITGGKTAQDIDLGYEKILEVLKTCKMLIL